MIRHGIAFSISGGGLGKLFEIFLAADVRQVFVVDDEVGGEH
jgi:hypothetical protein